MSKSIGIFGGLILVLLIIGSQSFFIVDERERALLLWLGKIEDSSFEPGLHFKVPFFNSVRKFDGRIQSLHAEPERYLTAEKKNVIVDSFIMWRISDVAQYYRSTGGSKERAELRLSQIIRADLRSAFGRRTMEEVISGERSAIMESVTRRANKEAEAFGITIADVRIKRVDLPEDVSESVYARMRSERERVARQIRARGAEIAEQIRSGADRQRTVLLANAKKESERIRGEGDAQAARIYAEAFSQAPKFYALYRRLLAYRNVFSEDGNNLLLLEPKGDFFQFFNPKAKVEAEPAELEPAKPKSESHATKPAEPVPE